ncbi:MAG: DUF3592 domain-containing protein [Ruminococcus flavefaciens]|nr:DUF3592 domain-containing protein [Ruminococcus flavefaciens]
MAILASVILLIISLFSLFIEYRMENVCTDLAVAEVVRIERKSSRTNTKYRFIVRYIYNYKEYRKTGNYISSKPYFKSNDIVPIKVNPKNPSEYYLSYESRYTENMILFSVGILGLIIALIDKHIIKKKNDNY